VTAVAAGALPDGTPVIISGSRDGTVRVWRTADSTPVGEPLAGHGGPVTAVAAGALPDGTPVIISGSHDGTVRVWRTADGARLVPPLNLPQSVRAVAVHDNVIIAAGGSDIAVHQLSAVLFPGAMTGGKPSDNGRLSGTTQTPAGDHAGGGPPPGTRLGHVIRYIQPSSWRTSS
jgi:hypothetical protein